MTAEQLEELLGKVTQGEWEVVAPPDGIWPPRVFSGSLIICMVDNSDADQDEKQDNATLIAIAPSLARRVIAAEKLVEALEGIAKTKYGLQGIMEDYEGEEYERKAKEYYASLTSRYERSARDALTAYREASK